MARNNLVGQTFGRLTVVKDDGTRTSGQAIKWLCRCECGAYKHVKGSHLKRGRVKSCGCLNDELKRERYRDLTDFSNKAFEVIKRSHSDEQRVYWRCRCKACGKEVTLNTNQIDNYKSCGCNQFSERAEHLDNIRDTKANWNTEPTAVNKTGVRGVSYISKKKLWRADIGANGKKIYLGSYKKKEDAIKARKKAEQHYWNK